MEFLVEFFSSDYMPHGHCFLWLPGILWLTVGADGLIALSYFSIPIALLIFIQKRPDLQFKRIALLFAAFILFCGITHLFSIYTIWHGTYGIAAILKSITAVVSFVTAVVVFRSIKPALAIPSPAEHEAALRKTLEHQQEVERLNIKASFDDMLRAAMDFMPSGVLVLKSDGEIVYINAEAERLFEYEPDELIGQNVQVLVPEKDRANHHSWMTSFFHNLNQRAMASGRVIQGRTKSAAPVSLEVSLMPKSVGQETYVFASVLGVNQVLNLEEKVLTHTNRLVRAINAADEGIWEWNVQTGDVWYSPRLLGLIGVDPESQEYSVDDWFTHIHPDDKSQVSAALQEHFDQRTPFKVQYRGRNEEGEYQWMQTRGEARFNSAGEPMFMSGTLVSVEELVALSDKLEEQIAVNEELSQDFVNTFELAAVGIAHVSPQGKWLRVNKRLCEIVGYTQGELMTLTFQDITHPDDLESDLKQLQKVIDGKIEAYSMEKRYFHKDGHIIWIYLTVSAVRSKSLDTGDLEPDYFISVIEDISERKRIEKDLAASNTELERFAYAASHDLQEPLRKISMFSDSLQDRLKGLLNDEEAEYELDRIGDAATRMKAMVAALMELSRAQRLEPSLEKVSLATLLGETGEQLETLIADRGARVNLLGDSLTLEVDKAAMLHVFQNLVTNAIRYCPESRSPIIDVSAAIAEGMVNIRFQDNGSGIEERFHEVVFEPFRRLAGKHIEGSGMGLPICKRIVEKHGGSIRIETTNDNGTCFLISIPQN